MKTTEYRILIAVSAAGLALPIALIWMPTYVPLFDLPNHMARHYIESLWLAGRDLGDYYDVRYQIMPNLGADLVVPPLMLVFPPLIACKIFLTGSVLLFWTGPAPYVRQLSPRRDGRSWLPVAALLLPWVLNGPFFWGFLNYYSGMGLAFTLLAHCGAMRERARLSPAEATVHAIVGILFLWHLIPWGIYLVVSGADTLGRLSRRDADGRRGPIARIVVESSTILPSVGMFLFYFLGREQALNPSSNFVWGGAGRKLTMWLSAFRGYDWTFDLPVLTLWVLAILFGFNLRGLSLHRRDLYGPAILAACYVILPSQLGSTTEADLRILPALLTCSVALLLHAPVRRTSVLVGLIGLVVGLRTASIGIAWQRITTRLEAEAKVFDPLPRRSHILPVVGLLDNRKDFPEVHFGAWTVVTSQASYPKLFTWSGGDSGVSGPASRYPCPLIIKKAAGESPILRREERVTVSDRADQAGYEYVLVLNPLEIPIEVPGTYPIVARSGAAILYRVESNDHPAQPARELPGGG